MEVQTKIWRITESFSSRKLTKHVDLMWVYVVWFSIKGGNNNVYSKLNDLCNDQLTNGIIYEIYVWSCVKKQKDNGVYKKFVDIMICKYNLPVAIA